MCLSTIRSMPMGTRNSVDMYGAYRLPARPVFSRRLTPTWHCRALFEEVETMTLPDEACTG